MKLHVDLKENGYDIILERGCLYRVSDYIDLKRKVMIIQMMVFLYLMPRRYRNNVRKAISIS